MSRRGTGPGGVRGDLATGLDLRPRPWPVPSSSCTPPATAQGNPWEVDVAGTRRLVAGGRPRPAAAPGLHLDRRRRPDPVRLLPRQVRRRAGAARLRPAGHAAAGHPVPRLRRRPARHGPPRPGPPGADGLAGAAGRRRRGRRARRPQVCAAPPSGGVVEFGGPEELSAADLARAWAAAAGAGRARGGDPRAGEAEHGLPGRRGAARRPARADGGPTGSTCTADRRRMPGRRSISGGSAPRCTPRPARRRFVDVPELPYLMIDGHGDPNTAPAYAAAVQALYSVAYAIRFALKRRADPVDAPVMPLEGLWWTPDMADVLHRRQVGVGLDAADPAAPELVTVERRRRRPRRRGSQARRRPARPRCGWSGSPRAAAPRCCTVGPYRDEGPTVAALHAFIAEHGLRCWPASTTRSTSAIRAAARPGSCARSCGSRSTTDLSAGLLPVLGAERTARRGVRNPPESVGDAA